MTRSSTARRCRMSRTAARLTARHNMARTVSNTVNWPGGWRPNLTARVRTACSRDRDPSDEPSNVICMAAALFPALYSSIQMHPTSHRMLKASVDVLEPELDGQAVRKSTQCDRVVRYSRSLVPPINQPLGTPGPDLPEFSSRAGHRLVTIGDSLTQGLTSGAVFRTDLSWP